MGNAVEVLAFLGLPHGGELARTGKRGEPSASSITTSYSSMHLRFGQTRRNLRGDKRNDRFALDFVGRVTNQALADRLPATEPETRRSGQHAWRHVNPAIALIQRMDHQEPDPTRIAVAVGVSSHGLARHNP